LPRWVGKSTSRMPVDDPKKTGPSAARTEAPHGAVGSLADRHNPFAATFISTSDFVFTTTGPPNSQSQGWTLNIPWRRQSALTPRLAHPPPGAAPGHPPWAEPDRFNPRSNRGVLTISPASSSGVLPQSIIAQLPGREARALEKWHQSFSRPYRQHRVDRSHENIEIKH